MCARVAPGAHLVSGTSWVGRLLVAQASTNQLSRFGNVSCHTDSTVLTMPPGVLLNLTNQFQVLYIINTTVFVG